MALAVGASAAQANDRLLKATVAKWSHRIAVDAHGIGLSALNRHPRRMTRRAQLFRRDALRARRAIAAQKPSSAKGRRARALGIAAFADYAVVGREWVLSGQARVQGRKAVAVRHAGVAERFSVKGNRLLVATGRLLR